MQSEDELKEASWPLACTSRSAFDAFAEHLGPLLSEHGVTGEPVAGPIERILIGGAR